MLLIKILKHLGKIIRIKLDTNFRLDTISQTKRILDFVQNCDYRLLLKKIKFTFDKKSFFEYISPCSGADY